jgi:hypothetical protein
MFDKTNLWEAYKNMSEEQQQNNQLQAQNQSATAGLEIELFKEVDFTGMRSLVSNMGSYEGEVSDVEREMGLQVIGQWQDSIVGRLRDRGGEMNRFLTFFEVNGCKDVLFEEVGADLAQKTNTTIEFGAVLEAKKALEAEQAKRPNEPIIGLETTQEEEMVAKAEYELEVKKHRIRVEKTSRTLRAVEQEWKSLLKENPQVRELVVKAHKYNQNLKGFYGRM